MSTGIQVFWEVTATQRRIPEDVNSSLFALGKFESRKCKQVLTF